jgi:hypothetical protein
MTPALKAGDRVAVYQSGQRYIRTVAGVTDDGMVSLVMGVAGDKCMLAHPKQVRRLVPRKRREWKGRWQVLYNGDGSQSIVFSPEQPFTELLGIKGLQMTLREVKPCPKP